MRGIFSIIRKNAKLFQNKGIFTDFFGIFIENKRILAKSVQDSGREMPLAFCCAVVASKDIHLTEGHFTPKNLLHLWSESFCFR